MELDVVGTLVKVVLTFGLLFLTLKLIGRFMGPQAGKVRHTGRPVEIMGRTSLGKAAQIVLVRLGDRSYALGVSQQGVQMLTEVDLDGETVDVTEADRALAAPVDHPARTQGPVTHTSWRDMIESLRERTVRH